MFGLCPKRARPRPPEQLARPQKPQFTATVGDAFLLAGYRISNKATRVGNKSESFKVVLSWK